MKDEIIIDRIQRSGQQFVMTSADERELKSLGVSAKVINAMKSTTRVIDRRGSTRASLPLPGTPGRGQGERGELRVASRTVRFAAPRDSTNRTIRLRGTSLAPLPNPSPRRTGARELRQLRQLRLRLRELVLRLLHQVRRRFLRVRLVRQPPAQLR